MGLSLYMYSTRNACSRFSALQQRHGGSRVGRYMCFGAYAGTPDVRFAACRGALQTLALWFADFGRGRALLIPHHLTALQPFALRP